MRRLPLLARLGFAGVFGALVFWACHIEAVDSKDKFKVVGDSTWTQCDKVMVLLVNDSGRVLDTLFNDTLRSLSQLNGLSADQYHGGEVNFHIKGFLDTGVCFEQNRVLRADGHTVVVDTVLDPGAKPVSVQAVPDSVVVALNGNPVTVNAAAKPAYVEQSFDWSVDGSGVVALEFPAGVHGNPVKAKPLKTGAGWIKVRSRRDSTRYDSIPVRVKPPTLAQIDLDKDSLVLYLGGSSDSLKATVLPAGADQRVQWKSADSSVAAVDSLGRVTPVSEGQTSVQAQALGTTLFASALVQVKRDSPLLLIFSKSGANVNVPIVFQARVIQNFGTLVWFKHDLQGDGSFDSIPGPFFNDKPGDTVNLPAVSASYPKEGKFTARFLVRDVEGNEVGTQVELEIGNQAPEILAIRADTTLSIKDSILMTCHVQDADGKVAAVLWDFDGDGKLDDSSFTNSADVKVTVGHRYNEPGNFKALLRVRDDVGKTRDSSVKVKVELDPPVADAGEDTSVLIGSDVSVHAKGSDKFGSIAKREVKFGAAPFVSLSKQDTVMKAPATAGDVQVVVRVTDDDGLSDEDTMTVSVFRSASADLSDLIFSGGALEPAFKPSIRFYSARVGFKDSLVTVTPTAKDAAALISVNAKTVGSGRTSDAVKVLIGSNLNIFHIVVTAPDDSTQKEYFVSVARDPSADATLGKLEAPGFTLAPPFSSTVLDYADTVPNAVASITLKPTVTIPTATVRVNDSLMASGTFTFPMPLAVGDNLFKVLVIAQDGINSTTYQVKIVRLAKLIVTRRVGAQAPALLDSVELPLGSAKSISSPSVAGFHFAKWSLLEGAADLSDSTANPANLTVKAAKVRVQAEFLVNRFTITAGANAGGSIIPSGVVTLDQGQSQSYAINPQAGFRIASVKVDGKEDTSAYDGTFDFSNVAANHSIAVVFLRTFTITAKAGAGGSATPASATVDSGASHTVTITPNNGFRISSVKVDGGDVALASFTFAAVSANHSLDAAFTRGFTLTATAGPGGTITPATVGVDSGGSQTFTVTPASGFRLKALIDNGKDVTASVSAGKYALANITLVHTLSATFLRVFNVSASAAGKGTAVAAPTAVDSGATSQIALTADPGFILSALTDNGADALSKVTGDLKGKSFYNLANVAADHDVKATFKIVTFLITATAGTGGTVTPPSAEVDTGADFTFLFKPQPGYRFLSLNVDGIKSTPTKGDTEFTFTKVARAHALAVVYRKTFRVTVGPAAAFSIHDTTVDTLANLNIVITPPSGYFFTGLTDNGVAVPTTSLGKYSPANYALASIAANHDLAATFKRFYVISTKVTGPVGGIFGTFTPDVAQVDSGANQSFVIVPSTGFFLSKLTDNVADVLGNVFNSVYTVSNVNGAHDLVGEFTRGTSDLNVKVVSNVPRAKDMPKLTLTVEKPETADSIQVKLPGGTKITIEAVLSFTPIDCGIRICAPLAFQGWELNGKALTTKNPVALAVPLEGDAEYRAIYSEKAPGEKTLGLSAP